jgi:uncharacterized protein YdaT
MPWNAKSYPASMKNLSARVRKKAIEVANALLKEGYEEGRAISIAIATAKMGTAAQAITQSDIRRCSMSSPMWDQIVGQWKR